MGLLLRMKMLVRKRRTRARKKRWWRRMIVVVVGGGAVRGVQSFRTGAGVDAAAVRGEDILRSRVRLAADLVGDVAVPHPRKRKKRKSW